MSETGIPCKEVKYAYRLDTEPTDIFVFYALGGVSGVASFITTDEQLQQNRGCCFLVQAMLPEGFPFHQFNGLKNHEQ